MDTQEILSAALKLEQDGRTFYTGLAKKAPNAYAKSMFTSFAADEGNHIRWIEGMAGGKRGWRTSSDAVEELYATLKKIFADIPADKKGKLAAAKDDTAQIDIAIGKEEESIRVYGQWASSAEDRKVRELFTNLVEIEKNHRKLLSNTKTYLSSNQDWFMKEEQWSFDGG